MRTPRAAPPRLTPACPHVPRQSPPESPMNRYVAPLGFTLAAVWILVVVVLVSPR
ncbi:hypothetical protein [Polymorphospora sp. NPDC050346]|uniref:hypothetical protein n=1 Tax=Polymorphospora sp. NPDC050346 TaxID=3155780 RepID=UPI0033F4B067